MTEWDKHYIRGLRAVDQEIERRERFDDWAERVLHAVIVAIAAVGIFELAKVVGVI